MKSALFFFIMLIYISSKGQLIYTIGGNGVHANQGNNVLAICTPIAYPHGFCVDGNGNMYLTCSNSIRKINLSTGIITYVAGSDTYGHTGDGGPALNATLQFPYDVCIDNSGNLYISEWGGHYIRKINIPTGIISTVAGNGSGGFGGDGGLAVNAQLNRPQGITADASGNIYFTDTYNSRIRKINASTGIISTIAGTGAAAYSGDGGPAINAGIPYPADVSIDGSRNLYFVEVFGGNTSRVRKINSVTGIITTVAGNGAYSFSGDGGPATSASLFDPSGIVVDGPGNIYISEYDDSRIRKVDVNTGIINTIAGTGVNGFSGDGGSPLNAQLYYPLGLCLDTNGDLYIADSDNQRIRKISNTITLLPSLTTAVSISSTPQSYCPGTPVTFSASVVNGSANSYTWIVNNVTVSTNPVSFTTATLNNGDVVTCTITTTYCDNTFPITSNPIKVQFNSSSFLPAISIRANDTTICTGENVTFTAAPQNAGNNPSYQWKLNGVNTGTNSATFVSSGFADGDKINCVITSDPASSCGPVLTASSDTITMIVAQQLAASLTIVASSNDICPGTMVSFSATPANGGISPSFQWKINGSPIGSNSAMFNYNNFSNNDIVTCEVTPSTGGCSSTPASSNAITIAVRSIPTITLIPLDTIVALGTQVQLNANISNSPGGSSYQWNPSSLLSNAGSLNPLTVPLIQNVEFQLTVSSAGCTNMAKSVIKIFTKLFMPTAFTPNGDGLNDIYRIPKGVVITLKEFSIYDRWGNKIFTTTDINKGWDGSYKGIRKETAAFVFVVSGSDDKGPVFQKGTFILIR